jgi:hypothetical protein
MLVCLIIQVVSIDYPRPDLENTVNYLEAASLSSSFCTSPRPSKALEVVIAGAGRNIMFFRIENYLKAVYF